MWYDFLVMKLKTIEQVEKFHDKKFQKNFGVSKITFAAMVTIFDRLCIFSAY